MDSQQLEQHIGADTELHRHFRGVFARNTLPAELRPGAYIVNTKNKDQVGEHWISLWVNEDAVIEFMDPLAKSPVTYGWSPSRPYIYNRDRIQPKHSVLCGAYCLYYLYFRCRGKVMQHIIGSLLPLSKTNDDLMKIFLGVLSVPEANKQF